MFASRGFRISALVATLVMAFSLMAVDTAEARRGGSFGSRGMFTGQSVPRTPTSPMTAPVQKSMTQGTAASTAATAAAYRARPSFWGGFGGGLLGGFLFSGLFGMMFGYGFGGFGGILALLVQVAIVWFILSLVFRRRPAIAGGGPSPYSGYSGGSGSSQDRGARSTSTGPRSRASERAGSRDQIGLSDRDLGAFEQRLAQLQDAFSREDFDGLREIATPEVMSYLSEELAANARKGLRNEVYDVRLLSGDIAQAWREGNTDYATVAMRYESRDVTREVVSGRIVTGEDRPTETVEVWTFVRTNGGPWIVSAIQEAGR